LLPKITKKFIINKQIFVATTITISVIAYFSYYALFGDKGVLKYFSLKTELHKKELTRERLENKMNKKQHLVNGMGLESLDLDLLDEEARKNLGYANKDEIVIYNQQSEIKK
jgi:cell division protein FtsB